MSQSIYGWIFRKTRMIFGWKIFLGIFGTYLARRELFVLYLKESIADRRPSNVFHRHVSVVVE